MPGLMNGGQTSVAAVPNMRPIGDEMHPTVLHQDPAADDASGDGAGNGQAPVKRQATPEEQAAYDNFVKAGYALIYAKETAPAIINRLKQGNPVSALAMVTVMVVKRVVDAMEQHGQPPDNVVLIKGGTEILADLADLARKHGTHTYTDQEIQAATIQAARLYKQMATQGSGQPQGAEENGEPAPDNETAPGEPGSPQGAM